MRNAPHVPIYISVGARQQVFFDLANVFVFKLTARLDFPVRLHIPSVGGIAPDRHD